MARTNYKFEKRRRELAKKKKKEEKRQRKENRAKDEPADNLESPPDEAAAT